MATEGNRFDLVVIGAGPGGYVAAIRGAQLGLSTVVVERDKLGGRCLNYACIPAKAVLRSADVLAEVRQAATFGVAAEGADLAGAEADFEAVAKRRDRVVRTMTGGVKGLLANHDVTVIEGTASLGGSAVDGGQLVNVTASDGNTHPIAAARIVIATGSVAKPILGVPFGGPVIDTAGAWLATARPSSLAVVGCGASGVEVASAYGRFGTRVTLIEALPQILPADDPEIAELVGKELAKQNVETLVGAQLSAIEPQAAGGVTLTVNGETRQFDAVCIAAGRAPDVEALGLATAGVALDEHGMVQVDDHQRTSNPAIFAIGDIVRGPALAHKASDEGIVAVEAAAGHAEPDTIDHAFIPRATFCQPQVAAIGLTEPQAQATGRKLAIGRFPLAAAGAATVYGDRTGLVKIIGDADTGELLGAHIVGAKAADLISELAVARAAQVGYADLARIVHPHPTLSEALLEAARAADGWLIHG